MTHSPTATVTVTRLTFAWPDGTTILSDVTAAFGAGRTGLVGLNGAGKSTVLRLIAGLLQPTSGSITVSGTVGYLPQQVTLDADTTAADLLDITAKRRALRAIESGDADPAHFEILGDDWDIEARARAQLDEAGLSAVSLDRPMTELSGGEAILTALVGLRLAATPIVLLDEPTNNLDRDARALLYRMVDTWRGALIVVSHDLDLLDRMTDTAELRDADLRIFGGPYSVYREQIETEQAAARQALRTAEQKLDTEKRQRVQAETALARRARTGRKMAESKSLPKILLGGRKNSAEVTAGKVRGSMEAKVDAAKRAVEERADSVRSDDHIRIDLPDPRVPTGRQLARFRTAGTDTTDRSLTIVGPERIALVGGNGAGKTRLLERLLGRVSDSGETTGDPTSGGVGGEVFTRRIGYLPQRMDHLDDAASSLDTVREVAPDTSEQDVRAHLARFLFRGDSALRPVGSLSGGERFRVALARLLVADPPNELLILDEPTNNLDIHSVDELVDALADYRGGLIVVSHDDRFLARLRPDRWWRLDRSTGLTAIDPLAPEPAPEGSPAVR